MTELVTLTRDIIGEGKSLNGGWSEPQLRAIGVEWPPTKGWIKRVEGSLLPAPCVAEFLALKDAHIPGAA